MYAVLGVLFTVLVILAILPTIGDYVIPNSPINESNWSEGYNYGTDGLNTSVIGTANANLAQLVIPLCIVIAVVLAIVTLLTRFGKG